MEGEGKFRWLFVSGVVMLSYIAFLGHACFSVYDQVCTYKDQIEGALIDKNMVLKENASGDLLADVIIQRVDASDEVQFDVHTSIDGQDQAYLKGTFVDGQVKQLQYQEIAGIVYRQMIQALKESKVLFYRLEVKQTTAKGLMNDNRVFTIKQGKDCKFKVEVEKTN